jgi:hypothetical protein
LSCPSHRLFHHFFQTWADNSANSEDNLIQHSAGCLSVQGTVYEDSLRTPVGHGGQQVFEIPRIKRSCQLQTAFLCHFPDNHFAQRSVNTRRVQVPQTCRADPQSLAGRGDDCTPRTENAGFYFACNQVERLAVSPGGRNA